MISSYVCVDLETTGCNAKGDKIIEIGAVKVENGKVVDTFHSFVNPGRKLSEKIIELTSIQDKQLEEADDIEVVFPKFLDFSKDMPLVGHQILFDYSFLKKAAVNQKNSYERDGIDTLKIARKYLPLLPSRKLSALCEFYNIDIIAHRALEDAKATTTLFEILKDKFLREENKQDFMPKKLLFHVKKDSPITKVQKERLERLVLQHNLEITYDISKLTKSEASRYTDQILATFGR